MTDDPAKWMVGTPLYKAIKAEVEHRMYSIPSLKRIERHFTVVVEDDEVSVHGRFA